MQIIHMGLSSALGMARLAVCSLNLKNNNFCEIIKLSSCLQKNNFHTSKHHYKGGMFPEPKKWPKYNEKVFSPQQPDEEKRPAVSITSLICTLFILVPNHYKYHLAVQNG